MRKTFTTVLTLGAAAGAISVAFAQGGSPAPAAAPSKASRHQSITGTIEAYDAGAHTLTVNRRP